MQARLSSERVKLPSLEELTRKTKQDCQCSLRKTKNLQSGKDSWRRKVGNHLCHGFLHPIPKPTRVLPSKQEEVTASKQEEEAVLMKKHFRQESGSGKKQFK